MQKVGRSLRSGTEREALFSIFGVSFSFVLSFLSLSCAVVSSDQKGEKKKTKAKTKLDAYRMCVCAARAMATIPAVFPPPPPRSVGLVTSFSVLFLWMGVKRKEKEAFFFASRTCAREGVSWGEGLGKMWLGRCGRRPQKLNGYRPQKRLLPKHGKTGLGMGSDCEREREREVEKKKRHENKRMQNPRRGKSAFS